MNTSLVSLIGVIALVLVLFGFIAMSFRVVVTTNFVHIVQSARPTVGGQLTSHAVWY
jgi:hypothetical protein